MCKLPAREPFQGQLKLSQAKPKQQPPLLGLTRDHYFLKRDSNQCLCPTLRQTNPAPDSALQPQVGSLSPVQKAWSLEPTGFDPSLSLSPGVLLWL